MAKVLGALVGTPIASGLGFPAVSNRYAQGRNEMMLRDVATTASNVIGDTVSMGFFKSSALIAPSSTIWWAAFGASCTISIGDVNHTAGLTSALSVASAGTGPLMTAFAAAKMGQPLWQLLGYPSDPGGQIELLATFAGANPANVALAWEIQGVNS